MDDITDWYSSEEPPDMAPGGPQPLAPWADESGAFAVLPEPAAVDREPDHDHASPFSVAVGTVAGMAGVRALRDAWRRHRETRAAADDSTTGLPPVPAGPPDPAPRPEASAPSTDQAAPKPASSQQCPPDRTTDDARRASARLGEERAALVELCVELDDLLTNAALREKLRRGLRRVGVGVVEPTEEPFDAEVHHAVGTTPAPDPTRVGTLASVERAGFRDGGVELRPPDVIVYTAEGERRG